MNIEIFVQNIKDYCERKDVKPTVACREAGVGTSFINNMEARGSMPSIEKVQMLAQYLGVTVSDLLGETTPPAKPRAAGNITEGEAEMISAYREADPAIRRSVRKLLDLDADEGLQLVAARDGQPVTARTENLPLPDEDSPLP